MFSMAPNIVLAPNMTQNVERKHRMQDTNTANFRSSYFMCIFFPFCFSLLNILTRAKFYM